MAWPRVRPVTGRSTFQTGSLGRIEAASRATSRQAQAMAKDGPVDTTCLGLAYSETRDQTCVQMLGVG